MEYGGVLYVDDRTMTTTRGGGSRSSSSAEAVACWWEAVHLVFRTARRHEEEHGSFELPACCSASLVRSLARLKTQERRMGCVYSPEVLATAAATPLPLFDDNDDRAA